MEKLYTDLMTYLGEHLSELGVTTLDEDYSQLEALLNGEDSYPVVFPCILLGFGEAVWDPFKTGACGNGQRGTMTVTTRLAFDCYDDSHYGADQSEYAEERHVKAKALHELLHGYIPDSCEGSAMLRTASRCISLPGGIKVYETDYRLKLTD
jgi:hypothetical protein